MTIHPDLIALWPVHIGFALCDGECLVLCLHVSTGRASSLLH